MECKYTSVTSYKHAGPRKSTVVLTQRLECSSFGVMTHSWRRDQSYYTTQTGTTFDSLPSSFECVAGARAGSLRNPQLEGLQLLSIQLDA